MQNKHRKHFSITILASFVVHLFVLTALFTLPEASEEKEEYKKVYVRLGSSQQLTNQAIEDAKKYAQYSPSAGPNINKTIDGNDVVEQVPLNFEQKTTNKLDNEGEISSKVIKKKNIVKENSKSEKQLPNSDLKVKKTIKNVKKPAMKSAAKPRQKKIREHWDKEGIAIGNSKLAKKVSSYEQMLPLWLEKFKKYPEEARLANITGQGELFIKINRNGKVLLAKIIETTNYAVLDRAMMSMIAAADPVLPVPADYYPRRKTFSYKISVEFDGKI